MDKATKWNNRVKFKEEIDRMAKADGQSFTPQELVELTNLWEIAEKVSTELTRAWEEIMRQIPYANFSIAPHFIWSGCLGAFFRRLCSTQVMNLEWSGEQAGAKYLEEELYRMIDALKITLATDLQKYRNKSIR